MNPTYKDTVTALDELGVWCAAFYDEDKGHQLPFYMDLGDGCETATEEVELAAALLRNRLARTGRGDPGKQNLVEALEAMRAEVWARNFKPSPGRLDAGDRIREVPPLPLS